MLAVLRVCMNKGSSRMLSTHSAFRENLNVNAPYIKSKQESRVESIGYKDVWRPLWRYQKTALV